MINFHQRMKISDDALLQEIEGEMVLLNMATDKYYTLDPVGTRILMLLSENNSIEGVFSVLLEEYEVEPERLRNDLQSLVQDLLSQGLVEVI